MQCTEQASQQPTEQTQPMRSCVAVECCSPGHIHVAMCIRLLYAALMHNILLLK